MIAVVLAVLLEGTGATPGRMAVPDAVAFIQSTDRAKVQRGMLAVREAKGGPGGAALAQRIREGLPPDLLALAMDTLAGLPRSPASAVFGELCRHRRAPVRAKAMDAVVAVRLPSAQKLLIGGLSDADPEVRRATASGLRRLGARGAIPALLIALGQGVSDAAPAIAELATAEDVPRVVGALGGMGVDALAPALRGLLLRRDLAASAKLQIVAGLAADVQAPASQQLLVLVARKAREAPVRRAAGDALEGKRP